MDYKQIVEELCSKCPGYVIQNTNSLELKRQIIISNPKCIIDCYTRDRETFKEVITQEIAFVVIKHDIHLLEYIPKELRTPDIYKIVLYEMDNLRLNDDLWNGSLLEYIPDELITKQMCDEAVAWEGISLKYVPERFQTEKLYINAVNQKRGSIFYVPLELRPTIAKKCGLRNVY